jgi:hypothetical protein
MALDEKQTTFVLEERDIPTHWYNIVPAMPRLIGADDILVGWREAQ